MENCKKSGNFEVMISGSPDLGLGALIVHGLYENIHVNKLCNFKSNMHESSCQFKKQVLAVWTWSSDEPCGPWPSCYF